MKAFASLSTSSDAADTSLAQGLKAVMTRGAAASQAYVGAKWGCDVSDIDWRAKPCANARPFDNPNRPLWHWALDEGRRACVREGGEGCEQYRLPEWARVFHMFG
jgi:hypothetical protein